MAGNFDLKGFLNDPKSQADKAGAINFLKSKGIIDANGKPVEGMIKSSVASTPTTVDTQEQKQPGFFKSLYQGIASPVVNMLTRPGQLLAHATGIGGGKEEDLSADVPIGFGAKVHVSDPYTDAKTLPTSQIVKGEVGKGLGTVALGLGPVSGGAAFMGGQALEENKSLPVAGLYAVGGAVGGKVFDYALKGFGGFLTKAGETTLRQVAQNIEKSSLPLTILQKSKMASQLTRASEYLLNSGIRGSNDVRYQTVSHVYDEMEGKLQTFLDTNNTAKGIYVSKSAIIDDLNKMKIEAMRDSSNAPIIKKQIESTIQNIKNQYRFEKIPISRLNELKRSTYQDAYTKAGDKVLDWVEHDTGDIYRKAIEKATDGLMIEGKTIGEFNKLYGDIIVTKKLLKLVQFKNVSGKLVGRSLSSMLGALAGYEVGGKKGAIEGAATGFVGAAILPKIIEAILGAESRSALAVALNKLGIMGEKTGLSAVVKPVKGAIGAVGDFISGVPKVMKDLPRTNIPGTTGPELKASTNALKSNEQGFARIPGIVPKGEGLATQTVTPFTGFKDLTTKVLERLKGKSVTSKQEILDFTNMPELKQTERDLIRNVVEGYKEAKIPVQDFAEKVQDNLLKLKRITPRYNTKEEAKIFGVSEEAAEMYNAPARYENVVLPDNLRGNVSDYSEVIYNSPIKTSAGQVHFNNDFGSENYFGHTRIEDMADNQTRRVIEVQSDLHQRGRLAEERTAALGKGLSKDVLADVKLNFKNISPEKIDEYIANCL